MSGIVRWLAPHLFPQLQAGGLPANAGATPPMQLTGADVPTGADPRSQPDWQKNFAGLNPAAHPSYQSALDAIFAKYAPHASVTGSGVGEPLAGPTGHPLAAPQAPLLPPHLRGAAMPLLPAQHAAAAPAGLPGIYPGLLYPRYGQQPQPPQSGLPKFTGTVSPQSGAPSYMGPPPSSQSGWGSSLNPSSIRVDFHAPESPQ
jgi:hypothetical protein